MDHGNRLNARVRRACFAVAIVATALARSHAAIAACEPSGTLPPELVGQSGCQLTSIGITPLSDLGCGTYQGAEGGLYPEGANQPPDAHWLAGWTVAADIVPRGTDGEPDATGGRIGLASIGMSNSVLEFSAFLTRARSAPEISPRVVIVNGAQGGRPAEDWAQPASTAWAVLDQRLAAAGLSPQQLHVVWIKQANASPLRLGAFPAHAESLQADLTAIVQIAKARYPNLAIAYLSSRTRAYVTWPNALNPEPFAYESGFAVKWLIEEQIAGNLALRFTGPDAPAPWLAWGPYLWADGEIPREDGFVWSCADTVSDFTHPSSAGAAKVADELLGFFETEITARRWFLARTRSSCGLLGIEPVLALAATGAVQRMRRAKPRHRPA